MSFFRRRRRSAEREIPEPDWGLIEDHLDEDEEEADACKGWSIGGPADHPCAVYLTDRSIYVDVRPDASLTGAETIVIPFSTIGRCEVAPSDLGTPRLVIVFDPTGESDPDSLRAVGIDLRSEDQGWRFGKQVVERFEVKHLQTRYAYLNATRAPLLAEMEEMTAVEEALAERGAAPDAELNARVKQELGVEDTPFNT